MASPGRGSKAKGAGGELEVGKMLMEWAEEHGYDIDPKRNLEQVRGGGYDINGCEGLGIEVKRQEALSINTWWKQATRQADDDGTIPVLIWRQNRKPWSFKVRVKAAHYHEDGSGFVHDYDVVMDADNFKEWFINHLSTKE